MSRRGGYFGGSTIIGPRSGWFSFQESKKNKKKKRNKTGSRADRPAGPARVAEPAQIPQKPHIANSDSHSARLKAAKIGRFNGGDYGIIKADDLAYAERKRTEPYIGASKKGTPAPEKSKRSTFKPGRSSRKSALQQEERMSKIIVEKKVRER